MKSVYYMICAALLYLQACKKDRDVDLPHGTSLAGWTAISSFPSSGRLAAFGFGIGNKGYLGTGFAIDSTAGDFWEYDPANNHWTRKAELM